MRNAVAVAEEGRGGEVRYLGEIDTTEAATRKLVAKLAAKYLHLLGDASIRGLDDVRIGYATRLEIEPHATESAGGPPIGFRFPAKPEVGRPHSHLILKAGCLLGAVSEG